MSKYTKEDIVRLVREDEVEFIIVPGTVTIIDVTWGDANGDGAVDNKDIVRLKNFFARYDDETGFTAVKIYPSSNANGDDAIDNKDIVRLKTYLVSFDHGTGVSPVKLGPAA